nr:hypothetical protein [Tanacetum cinerariifolium]
MEYDIWAMKMEHYLCQTDYPIWQVIHNGNGPVSVITDTNGIIKVLPSKTTEEVVARGRERKARTTLLMALPEDHLAKFHKMADAKEMWEAIKSRFFGNDESKKMQKYLLKQQFKGFFMFTSEGLHKGYDRFQTLLIQLEIHGLDTLSFDDLYNNLRVFKRDVKSTTASSSITKNVVFVSAKNTSSTNDVNTTYSVSYPSVSKSQKEGSSSYNDEFIQSFFPNQSSTPQLNYNDLKQINDDDIEEMDLKWQVAMISMRIKKFYKRTGRKLDCRAKGNQDSKKRDVGYNGNKTRDNDRRPAYQDDLKALGTIDGEDMDWSGHVDEDAHNYALMAYSSSNSGSDNKVKSSSKACEESYARLKKLYDDQRDKLGDASVEITAYTLTLKKEEAQLLCHQQNQLAYEQKIRYGSILSYENEVLQTVFMNKASDLEYTPINDRFVDGMHAVPPLMIGNYMPSRPDVEIDYSKFTYGPKQISADESDSKPSEYAFCESDSSVETSTLMPKPVENALKVICEPKVWTDAPIFEEYESDSDNDLVSNVQEDKEKLSFSFTNLVKHVKTTRVWDMPSLEKHAFFMVVLAISKEIVTHEKRMAKQAELTKRKNKVFGQRENRPVWNNVERVNHQNKFVPLVLLTKTGKFQIDAARQSYFSQAASTITDSKVNTARPFVNGTRPKRNFYKTHSPNKSPFHNTITQKTTFSYQKVNAVENKSLSAMGGNRDTAVKASDDPHRALNDKGIVDSGCSRHMRGNKAYLADYQEFKGGSVSFGGSNGRITGKGKIKTGSVD